MKTSALSRGEFIILLGKPLLLQGIRLEMGSPSAYPNGLKKREGPLSLPWSQSLLFPEEN